MKGYVDLGMNVRYYKYRQPHRPCMKFNSGGEKINNQLYRPCLVVEIVD